jgi:DNA-binding transcriptional MocR family regulator
MSEARRREVLALAARYRCPIVEDDWAGDLRFDGDDLPTLYALDGGQHVIYLSTFSKKLMPGLRLGWATAPTPVMRRLVELKRIQDCGTSPLLQAGMDVSAGFDGEDLNVAARQAGVLYSRGEWFHSDGSGADTLRLTYSGVSEDQIATGVATLGRLVNERWPDGADQSRQRATETMPIF